jgi:hypothetical protein
VVIGVGDDHSRLAYRDLHGSEQAINASSTLRRALAWCANRAAGPSKRRRRCRVARSRERPRPAVALDGLEFRGGVGHA